MSELSQGIPTATPTPAQALMLMYMALRNKSTVTATERGIYNARRLIRTGRTDLIAAVERGNMSLNKALMLAGEKQPASAYQRLIRAWNACSEDEQARFFVAVGWSTK